MTEPRMVGVHLGTSEVRVAVYDADGHLRAEGEAEIGDQSTAGWERAFREAAPPLPDDGICSVAGTSGTAVPVDRTGEPVFRPQMYYDAAPEYAERIRETGVTDELSGQDISLSPTSPLPKILRLREEQPERFAEVEWILPPATWLLYRLRYGHATPWRGVETDWTNALKFGADVTPALPEWFEPLFATLELPLDLLPEIRPPGSYVGVAEGELAQLTGVAGCKLYQGMTDGNAAALAGGCLAPGDFSITTGAASVVKYVSDSIVPHDAIYYHRHPIEGYLPGAAFDSGVVLRWFCERLLNRSLKRGLELARSVTPGEEYEVFMQGRRSPFFDPGIENTVLGLAPGNDRSTDEVQGRLVRGIVTSVALAEYTYVRIVEDLFDTRIGSVTLMSDFSTSVDLPLEWWHRLRASIWGRDVRLVEPRTTAGLVIPAALLASVYDDAAEASDRLLQSGRRLDPDPDVGAHYEDQRRHYFNRWRYVANLYQNELSAVPD